MRAYENAIDDVSRRRVLKTIGAVAGAAIAGRDVTSAQAPQTRRPAEHDHQSASRLRPERAADDVLHRSGHPRRRSRLRRPRPGEHLDQAAVDWRRCGRKGRRGTASAGISIWSDIPNNVQLRWLEDDGHVTVFRNPSNNSNGNTFDFQGRQLSCEHLTRRVVRYEHDGVGHGDRRGLRGQAPELAERRRRAS